MNNLEIYQNCILFIYLLYLCNNKTCVIYILQVIIDNLDFLVTKTTQIAITK